MTNDKLTFDGVNVFINGKPLDTDAILFKHQMETVIQSMEHVYSIMDEYDLVTIECTDHGTVLMQHLIFDKPFNQPTEITTLSKQNTESVLKTFQRIYAIMTDTNAVAIKCSAEILSIYYIPSNTEYEYEYGLNIK